jgi:uncharacterized membrane protein
MLAFGFKFTVNNEGQQVFVKERSIGLELLATFFNILLVIYYQSRMPKPKIVEPIG